MAETPLPVDATSQLRNAAEAIRDTIDAFMINIHEGDTIIHPGRPTGRFLMEQGRMAPKSIITASRSESSLLGFGKNVLADVTWVWFLVLPGRIEDRALDALSLVDHAMRFVSGSPWEDTVTPCPFAKKPEGGATEYRNLYSDPDEGRGLSIWAIEWEQQIDLGSAFIPTDPIGVPLTIIDITSTIESTPNDGEILTKVPVP